MHLLDTTLTNHTKYMRAKQAAAYLGLPISSFYNFVAQGILPAPIKIGSKISVFSVSAIEDALKALNPSMCPKENNHD